MNNSSPRQPARFDTEQGNTTPNSGVTFVLLAIFWTVVIAAMAGWHYHQTTQAALENARTAARQSFSKDLVVRRWATAHGGVYVPATDKTPPNPYLQHVAERDIHTPSGRALTLVNPAYMIRQIHEVEDLLSGVRAHLTSLDPIRPDNAPDAWEVEALLAFQQGVEERSEIVVLEDGVYLRLMRPMVTETGCLKCHGHQGYQEGDIRGGISVAVPWEPYLQTMRAGLPGYGLGYGGLWVLGLLLLALARGRLCRYLEERLRTERRLREKEIYIRTIMDNLPIGIAVNSVKPEVTFDYMNNNFPRFYRTTREALDGPDRFWQSVYEDPWFREEMKQRVLRDCASGDPQRMYWEDIPLTRKGRHTRYISAMNTPIPGQSLMISTVWDTTERKLAEEQLRLKTQELEQRSAELERFTYTVSHDLKSPLVTIKAFLGFLEEDIASQDQERIARDMEHMRTATSRMGQLLDELLEMSRIGRVVNEPLEICLQSLVREVLSLVGGQALERGVTIEVDEQLPGLFGDRPRLLEIWQNLIGNAIKYMGDQAAPRIQVGSALENGERVFFVRDNGMGIAPEYQQKIFGLFEQLDKQSEGSGLGLALVKRIVELYQGRIWVESAGAGQGSCFKFTLPGALHRQKDD